MVVLMIVLMFVLMFVVPGGAVGVESTAGGIGSPAIETGRLPATPSQSHCRRFRSE